MPTTPPKSRRAKILMNLQSQLETITIGNGYSRDVFKVTTSVKPWRDTPEVETPTVYIIDENTKPKYHAGKLTEWSWFVSLFGVMRGAGPDGQLDMEEFITDIMECLQNNQRLAFPVTAVPGTNPSGAVIAHHRVLDIVTDNQLFSEIEGSQLFKISLELVYTACVDNLR